MRLRRQLGAKLMRDGAGLQLLPNLAARAGEQHDRLLRGGRERTPRRQPRPHGREANTRERGGTRTSINTTVRSGTLLQWPMADVVAKGGIGRLRVPRGASGTRYVSMRGLIGSRRVPST